MLNTNCKNLYSEVFLLVTRCLLFFSNLFLGLSQRIENIEVIIATLFSAFLDDNLLFGVLILDLVQIFLEFAAILLLEGLLTRLRLVVVLLGAVAERVANHELLAVLEQVRETMLGEIAQIFEVLLVLAELPRRVHEESAGENAQHIRLEVPHVLTNLKRVEGQEGVSRIVRVNEVVGEEPELETEMVKNTPQDDSRKGRDDEEYEQVETEEVDTLLEPDGPQSEAHECKNADDRQTEPEHGLLRGRVVDCRVKTSLRHLRIIIVDDVARARRVSLLVARVVLDNLEHVIVDHLLAEANAILECLQLVILVAVLIRRKACDDSLGIRERLNVEIDATEVVAVCLTAEQGLLDLDGTVDDDGECSRQLTLLQLEVLLVSLELLLLLR